MRRKPPIKKEGSSARIGKWGEWKISFASLYLAQDSNAIEKLLPPWFSAHPTTQEQFANVVYTFLKKGNSALYAGPRNIIASWKELQKILWEADFLLTGTTSSCVLTLLFPAGYSFIEMFIDH